METRAPRPPGSAGRAPPPPVAALLMAALAAAPSVLAAQGGELRLELGGARAFPPSGSEAAAATYAIGGLRAERWWPSGTAVFAGASGGLAADSAGGDWISGLAGAAGTLAGSGPVELGLAAWAYAFRVGDPFPYEAVTGRVAPELRVRLGSVELALAGEAGVGRSEVELRRGDRGRVLETDLWHWGGGPELRAGTGGASLSVDAGAFRSADGGYRSAGVAVDGGGRVSWRAELRVWDTPLGTETTGALSLTLDLGAWSARLAGGRTDPDPLVLSGPGAHGGATVGRRLVGFGVDGPAPVVALREDDGGVRALFRIEAPEADSVAVLGDFSEWDAVPMVPAGDAWSVELTLAPGTYHYGFLVDGQWLVPERAGGIVSDDWGRTNATLVIP